MSSFDGFTPEDDAAYEAACQRIDETVVALSHLNPGPKLLDAITEISGEAKELYHLAATLGEATDPHAAWESATLCRSVSGRVYDDASLRKAIHGGLGTPVLVSGAVADELCDRVLKHVVEYLVNDRFVS